MRNDGTKLDEHGARSFVTVELADQIHLGLEFEGSELGGEDRSEFVDGTLL